MEFITLELRSRLQSCNVFIAMKKDLHLKDVQIILSESDIMLVFQDYSIKFLLPFIRIIPASLSGLIIKDNWICFRLQTAPIKSVFGSFSTEIVTDSNKPIQLATYPRVLDDIKILFKNSECTILCTCCKNAISKLISFKRFLPFSDTEYDLDGWFCCKHNTNVVGNYLQPQESDYLYGPSFSILHKSIFASNLDTENKTLTCNRCLLHIGTFHAYNLLKIWNCCVDYKSQSNILNTVNATDPIHDFLMVIKNALNETLGDIILQTSLDKQMHYLVIKSMDCKLNLITEPSVISDTDAILLQQKYVAKVLYKYETSKTAITDYLDIKYYDVGLPVIDAGLKYLLSSTKRLPHIYRTTTDYFFGYIALEDIAT